MITAGTLRHKDWISTLYLVQVTGQHAENQMQIVASDDTFGGGIRVKRRAGKTIRLLW